MPVQKYGTTLEYSASGTADTVFTTVKSMTPPNVSRASANTSHLATASQAHTYQGSWIDGGEVNFTLQYDKTQYALLHTTILTASGNYSWRVNFADASTIDFVGHISKVGSAEIGVDDDDTVMVDVGIKVSGLPVFTPA